MHEITYPKLSLRGVRDEAIPWRSPGACPDGIASSRTPRNDTVMSFRTVRGGKPFVKLANFLSVFIRLIRPIRVLFVIERACCLPSIYNNPFQPDDEEYLWPEHDNPQDTTSRLFW